MDEIDWLAIRRNDGMVDISKLPVWSLMSYWAVRKLGYSAAELPKKPGVSQPSMSISVKRAEQIAKAEQLELVEN